MKKFILAISVLAFATILYGYSQYLKKEIISAVLQYQINLDSPPSNIFAISTSDQKIYNKKNLPKGTRFIGKLARGEGGYVIYFDTFQIQEEKSEHISAKSSLNEIEELKSDGVSAKIGKTLYKQTQSNVLGAIFKGSNKSGKINNSILPRGYSIKIEIN